VGDVAIIALGACAHWGSVQAARRGWCLCQMGCKGPATYSPCPIVQWNNRTNWPIGAGHPCIGCTEPYFWDTMPPFYLGVGSPVMGDDGLGLQVLERLQAEWVFDDQVRFVDGGTWGMALLPDIEDAGKLIFLDAINSQRDAPGDVLLLERDEIPLVTDHNKRSPHQVGLREVMAISEFRGTLPADTCAIGVVPQIVDIGTELSPIVQASVAACILKVIERLRAWGHTCTRRL